MQKLLAAAIILSTSTFSALAGTPAKKLNDFFGLRSGEKIIRRFKDFKDFQIIND